MKRLEKLEQQAAKKRESIKAKQLLLKKDQEALKVIEAEIDALKGEEYMKDINSLNLTSEEYAKFRKLVLNSRSSLMEIIDMLDDEKKTIEEGERSLYE